MKYYDANQEELKVGMEVMYDDGEFEDEGVITALLPSGEVEFEGEIGKRVVNPEELFSLPDVSDLF